MNLKLPLKAGESNAIGNAVYVFDGNGTHVATIFGRPKADFIVTAVNSAGAMREALEEILQITVDTESQPTFAEISEARVIAKKALTSAPVDTEKERMKGLLKAAKCPNCDGSGAYYGPHGEPCQCQWCDEKAALLKEMEGEC